MVVHISANVLSGFAMPQTLPTHVACMQHSNEPCFAVEPCSHIMEMDMDMCQLSSLSPLSMLRASTASLARRRFMLAGCLTLLLPTPCRKRETLTGDATIRYFDYLEDFGHFEGLLPNLFTEISTSKERSFSCVDFVDTPGLVDGDMKVRPSALRPVVSRNTQAVPAYQVCGSIPDVSQQTKPGLKSQVLNGTSKQHHHLRVFVCLLLQYPFPVKDTIMWMADHVDLILVFFDPIGKWHCSTHS